MTSIPCWLDWSDGTYILTVAEGPLAHRANVEVPADLVKRYREIQDQWLAMQRELLAIDNATYLADDREPGTKQ